MKHFKITAIQAVRSYMHNWLLVNVKGKVFSMIDVLKEVSSEYFSKKWEGQLSFFNKE